MSENTTEHPLTDQALSRLRKLAEGNGLSPDQIELVETQEKIYVIEGVTHLTPFCEAHMASYPGPVKGKERTVMPNTGALQMEAQKRRADFYEKRAWLPAALEELKTAPGEGWGLDGAKIALPSQSVILAANDVCPGCQGRKIFTCVQCHGQGTVVCTYCAGKGLEICYNCAGSGQSPTVPGQPCIVCQGKRYIPCRFCKSSGHLICPTCLGKKGTICPQCHGAGVSTQEIALACGATINFSLKGDAWPSGLRRGLDRLGTTNLPKGHADLKRLPDEPPKENEEGAPPQQNKVVPAIVRYQASLPYADLRLRFGGGRVALVAVFGKRGLTMGVPPFLDESLKPARDKLAQAAEGKLPLDKALEMRAMRDAFGLVTAGHEKQENLRKLYPLGLSPKTAQEIMQNMRRALDKHTLHVRAGAAVVFGVLAVAALAAFLMTPMHAQLMQVLPMFGGMAADFVALALTMTGAWMGVGKAVQFKLKRRFPDAKISLHAHAGSIGPAMLAGISIAWLVMLLLMPVKAGWVLYLLGFIIH
jgi:hypothetical protein